jgi:hypothetical protein
MFTTRWLPYDCTLSNGQVVRVNANANADDGDIAAKALRRFAVTTVSRQRNLRVRRIEAVVARKGFQL